MGYLENLKPGDPVYVPNEVQPYRVKCRDERYIICTKPFNPQRTVMYFIIDLKERYAFVGMKVIIQPEEEGPLPFDK